MNIDKIFERLDEIENFIGWFTHVKVNNTHGGNMRLGTFDQWLYSKHMDWLMLPDADLIPLITDPLGKYWNQPDNRRIYLDCEHAHLDEVAFDKLSEYSSSIPSGVYVGKIWKRLQDGKWLLCWYGESENEGMCSINLRTINILPERNYLYMYDENRTLIIEGQVNNFQSYIILQKQQSKKLIQKSKLNGK